MKHKYKKLIQMYLEKTRGLPFSMIIQKMLKVPQVITTEMSRLEAAKQVMTIIKKIQVIVIARPRMKKSHLNVFILFNY